MVESGLYEVYSKRPVGEGEPPAQPTAIELGKVKKVRDRFDGIVTVLESRHVMLKSVLTQVL